MKCYFLGRWCLPVSALYAVGSPLTGNTRAVQAETCPVPSTSGHLPAEANGSKDVFVGDRCTLNLPTGSVSAATYGGHRDTHFLHSQPYQLQGSLPEPQRCQQQLHEWQPLHQQQQQQYYYKQQQQQKDHYHEPQQQHLLRHLQTCPSQLQRCVAFPQQHMQQQRQHLQLFNPCSHHLPCTAHSTSLQSLATSSSSASYTCLSQHQQQQQQLKAGHTASAATRAIHTLTRITNSNSRPSTHNGQHILWQIRSKHHNTQAFHTSSSSMLAKKKGGWSSVPDPRHKRSKEQRKPARYLSRLEAGVPVPSSLVAAAGGGGPAEDGKGAVRPKVEQGKERFMRSLKIYMMVFMVVGVCFAGRSGLARVVVFQPDIASRYQFWV